MMKLSFWQPRHLSAGTSTLMTIHGGHSDDRRRVQAFRQWAGMPARIWTPITIPVGPSGGVRQMQVSDSSIELCVIYLIIISGFHWPRVDGVG